MEEPQKEEITTAVAVRSHRKGEGVILWLFVRRIIIQRINSVKTAKASLWMPSLVYVPGTKGIHRADMIVIKEMKY